MPDRPDYSPSNPPEVLPYASCEKPPGLLTRLRDARFLLIRLLILILFTALLLFLFNRCFTYPPPAY